jgi:hypothetical protein
MSDTKTQSIEPRGLSNDDRELVDLATAALVDPTLHTDVRLRLHREITELLQAVREDARAPVRRPAHASAREPRREHPLDLLAAVLVDPNVHTDLRMRLHREIREILRAARGDGR